MHCHVSFNGCDGMKAGSGMLDAYGFWLAGSNCSVLMLLSFYIASIEQHPELIYINAALNSLMQKEPFPLILSLDVLNISTQF